MIETESDSTAIVAWVGDRFCYDQVEIWLGPIMLAGADASIPQRCAGLPPHFRSRLSFQHRRRNITRCIARG